MNALERWGLFHINRYLTARPFFLHRLSLENVTKLAVSISFLVGFGITLFVALAEILFFTDLLAVISTPYLLFLFFALNSGLIAIEFWLLFHIGFQVVACYILSIEQKQNIDLTMRASLVRAILELNEPDVDCFGLDPYRQKSKHYWLQLLLYKIKVVLSNFIGKLIARKLLSRLGLRSYAPLISTLITGLWDAWIQKSVLAEARFRLASRLYVKSLLKSFDIADTQGNSLETLIRLIAVRIELFGQYNVNLHYLLTEIDIKMTGSVKDFHRLFDIQQLEKVYITLTGAEKKHIQSIARTLFAFKRKKLSQQERQLLSLFQLKPEAIEHTKKQFDQLFQNNTIDLLMEI